MTYFTPIQLVKISHIPVLIPVDLNICLHKIKGKNVNFRTAFVLKCTCILSLEVDRPPVPVILFTNTTYSIIYAII